MYLLRACMIVLCTLQPLPDSSSQRTFVPWSTKLLAPTMLGPSVLDVEPLLDRLVLFWSDARTPHEVLPSRAQRLAVSTWIHHR